MTVSPTATFRVQAVSCQHRLSRRHAAWMCRAAALSVRNSFRPASPGTQTQDTSLGVLYELVC